MGHPNYLKGNLSIGCDNEKAGFQSGDVNTPTRHHQAHIDILTAIRRLQQKMRTSITFFHIYGHQDQHTAYNHLSWEAQLNVQVDKEAQSHLDWAFEHDRFVKHPRFLMEGWTVDLGGIKMVDKLSTHVKEWIGHHKLRQYLFDKGYSWTVIPKLTFAPLALYLSQQTQSFQLWYVKHCTNFCGIGKEMKRMKRWKDDLCPCCQKFSEESTSHLFICPEATITAKRQQLYSDILEWLEKVDTCPVLLEIITEFWHGHAVQFDVDTPYVYRQMYQTMLNIGVRSMWNGMLPEAMVEIQDIHLKLIGSNRTGQKWARDLVGKILRATHALWLHRNAMLHIRTAQGMPGMDMVQLKEAVDRQLSLGKGNMHQDDWYLLERSSDELMTESIDGIRGWLCDIYIARGQHQDAVDEGKLDRASTTVNMTNVTEQQRREFLDWRNIRLNRAATSDEVIEG